MKTDTKSYDPFDHLLNDDEIGEYLTNAISDDDPAIFVIALGYAIKRRGVATVAKSTGLNRESLYKFISGKTKPQWETVSKIAHSLGINMTVNM